MSAPPVTFLGAPGSPYTRKMLAALRYRRIPYRLIVGSHRTPTDLPKPKPQLLPTFYFTKADGSIEAVVDSTPLLRRFERDYSGRSIVPPDPAIAGMRLPRSGRPPSARRLTRSVRRSTRWCT